MFCSSCGKPIDENARFCPECGAKTREAKMGTEAVPTVPPQKFPTSQSGPIQGRRVTENIYLCQDGVYRWAYEYSLMKNPTILFTVLKVLGLSVLIMYAIVLIMLLFSGDFGEIGGVTVSVGISALIVFALGFIGYFIYAAINGWKYCVMFEMDESGVTHKQMDRTAEKAGLIREISLMAGILSGNATMTGNALMTRTSMRSDFAVVKNIKVLRGRHTIKVNALFEKNQVYAEPADFDFVLNYIEARIPAGAQRK